MDLALVLGPWSLGPWSLVLGPWSGALRIGHWALGIEHWHWAAGQRTRPTRPRGQHCQDEQPLRAGIPHAVRNAFGCDEQIAGLHRQLTVVEEEEAAPFEDEIHLVHSGVRMKRVHLAWLERVETNQHSRRLEEGALPHSVRLPQCVLARLQNTGVLHETNSTRTARDFGQVQKEGPKSQPSQGKFRPGRLSRFWRPPRSSDPEARFFNENPRVGARMAAGARRDTSRTEPPRRGISFEHYGASALSQ